jgi:hypothetical protein
MKRATQRSKATLTVLGRLYASPDLNRQEKGALHDAMSAVRERERRLARKKREAEAVARDAGDDA